MIHLQSNNKQQVVTDGNPYLCEDCILERPIERLDVQVLLDPFEERLDGPALSVQFSNGNCFKGEVIRQESIHYVLRKVIIDNQAQQIRVLLGCKWNYKLQIISLHNYLPRKLGAYLLYHFYHRIEKHG